MKPNSSELLVVLLSCLWTSSLAGVKELRLPVPTSETIALVAREMGAATYEESVEEADSVGAESGRRVQRRLVTGIQDIDDNTEYQEYQGVMGRPGVDFPVLPNIPSTSFSCRALRKPGYYADLDTDCQVFHICDGGRKISFLCPNGTIFRQSHLICDWWFRVDCGKSVELYEESAEQLAADQRIYKARADAITRAMVKGLSTKDLQTEQSGRPFDLSSQVQRGKDQRSSKVSGPKSNAAVFSNARENYENRQNTRKTPVSQVTSNVNRKTNYTSEQAYKSNNSKKDSQSLYKSESQSNTDDNVGEKEQQVFSETASFARNNGNRFGKQFYQDTPKNYPDYKNSQASTLPNSFTPEGANNDQHFNPNSAVKFVSTEDILSTTQIPFSTVNSTRTTPGTAQRSARPSGRLLPTASQNNNLRPKKSRNRQFSNHRQLNLQHSRSTNKPLISSSQNNFESPTTQSYERNGNVLQSFPAAQNSFVRPSPDLIPPETDLRHVQDNTSSLNQNGSNKVLSQAVSENKNIKYVKSSKETFTTSPTQASSGSFQSINLPSSTTKPTLSNSTPQRRPKQRRFTSTTQKPIFTVKFRPSKSFSYVELERTSSSTETSTFQSSETSRDTFEDSVKASAVITTLRPSEFVPSTNNNSPGTPEDIKIKSSDEIFRFDQFKVKDESLINHNDEQLGWMPTGSPETYSSIIAFSSSTPTPSYSPTIPTQASSTLRIKNNQKSNLPAPFVSVDNDSSKLDKITIFGNIDPAEINLLPSDHKQENRQNVRVPDSSGPNALHTLALYYATSESDSVTSPAYNQEDTYNDDQEEGLESLLGSHSGSPVEDFTFDIVKINSGPKKSKTKISDEILLRSHSGSPDDEAEIDNANTTIESVEIAKDLPSVLTKATKDSYAFLFNSTSDEPAHSDEHPCDGDVIDLDKTTEKEPDNSTYAIEKELDVSDDVKNDLDIEQSRGIVQPTEDTITKQPLINIAQSLDSLPDELKLKESTNLRELAQVFSRALSAYLEDPDSFRRILSEVRPTEPTNAYGTTLSFEENEDEVLDFSDDSEAGRLSSNNLISDLKSKSPVDHEDIDNINDLVQAKNISGPNEFTTSKNESNEEFQQYTTMNPTSVAEDINFVFQESKFSASEATTEDSYSFIPGNTEQSMPKYGGFFNNSGASEYKAYGSEIPEESTGRPLTEIPLQTETYLPVTTTIEIETETSESKNLLSDSSQIDIASIPDKLGIGNAQDINSLIDVHKNCNETNNHESTSESYYLENNVEKKSTPLKEDDLYDNDKDQEKLLVASGSQSFVSRDNYVRFIGAKPERHSKVDTSKGQIPEKETDISTTQKLTTIKGRGSIRFDSEKVFSEGGLEQTNTRRPHKELAFQNINLGNGVTLERTKTLHHSTTSVNNVQTSSIAPSSNYDDIDINPLAINSQLGFISEDLISPTNNPLQNIQSTGNVIRATTYHPPQRADIQDSIPPRGFLRNSWKWNAGSSNKLEVSSPLVNDPPSEFSAEKLALPNRNSGAPASFSNVTFTSTLLPPNVTIETAEDEMLEQKAEEIFGKLNKTSADMLMNVMNQAESNMTVRRLVLLLVADRNGRENKSHEESRAQLIQALLKTSETMPTSTQQLQESHQVEKKAPSKKTSRSRGRGRDKSTSSTTTQTSITQIRGRGGKSYRDTESETTVNAQKRMDGQHLRSPNLFPQDPSVGLSWDPDARAVELLKSLYNIAARWG